MFFLGSVLCRQHINNLSCYFRIQDFDVLRIETSEVLSRYYTHPVFSLSVNFWGRIRVPVQCDENLNSFIWIGVTIILAICDFFEPRFDLYFFISRVRYILGYQGISIMNKGIISGGNIYHLQAANINKYSWIRFIFESEHILEYECMHFVMS